ncbi:MAG: diguanylate cyclase domain-containing protein [Burkholderiales bacterium]
MRDRDALHALVVDSLEEPLAVIDRAGTIVGVNRAWTAFGAENGLSPGFAGVGSGYLAVLDAAAGGGDALAKEAARGMEQVLGGARAAFHLEYPCHSPHQQRWFVMRIAPLQGGDRKMFVVSHHDITQRKLAQERAEHLALHDALTGLANRRQFSRFLGEEIRRGARGKSAVGLVAFDLDGFKEYNDALGHVAGDRCLVGVAGVLAGHARRATDLAARLGGDEFALVLGSTDLAGAGRIAHAVREDIAELQLVYLGARKLSISAGYTSLVPGAAQTEEGLLQEADKALYAAKAAGGNRARAYSRS